MVVIEPPPISDQIKRLETLPLTAVRRSAMPNTSSSVTILSSPAMIALEVTISLS